MESGLYHFPIVCSRSEHIKKLTIINNDQRINVKVLTRMWDYFNSRASLKPNLVEFYEQVAKELFEEFIKHKYAQIICQVVTQPNDEKGVTLVKNKDEYICLDIANRLSSEDEERVLVIELSVCCH